MRPGRPPAGFQLEMSDRVRELLNELRSKSDAHARHVNDTLELLKMTGHRIGKDVPQRGPTCRIFKALGNPRIGLPDLTLVYHTIQDRLIIEVAA